MTCHSDLGKKRPSWARCTSSKAKSTYKSTTQTISNCSATHFAKSKTWPKWHASIPLTNSTKERTYNITRAREAEWVKFCARKPQNKKPRPCWNFATSRWKKPRPFFNETLLFFTHILIISKHILWSNSYCRPTPPHQSLFYHQRNDKIVHNFIFFSRKSE